LRDIYWRQIFKKRTEGTTERGYRRDRELRRQTDTEREREIW